MKSKATKLLDDMSDKVTKFFPKRTILMFNVMLVGLVTAFVLTLLKSNLMQNVESRAISDVQTTMDMQVAAFRDHMDEEFQALRLIADMLSDGRDFSGEEIRPTLVSIVRTFRLCTLCLADTNGDTVNYLGEVLGNCSDRMYFREIADGSHSEVCEYLATTKAVSEPRVILSVPAYDKDGQLTGVLFCSKEISVLEDSLFKHNELFDSASAIFICDESGQIIAANEAGHEYFSKHGLTETLNINDLGGELQAVRDDQTVRHVMINGIHCFAGYKTLDDCGWGLYCLVDESDATQTYHENQERIRRTVITITAIFAVCIGYIFILGESYIRKVNREAVIIKQYNDNYKNILNEAHCAVVEYDTDTKQIITLQENFGDLELGKLDGSLDAYEDYKQLHPEFDFEELESEIDIARKNGRTCSFETILAPDPGRFYWLKTKLIPIADENGELTRVYCVMFDVSDLHRAHETALDTYAQIPGAVYRCVLTWPIHLNYYSDGLCKLLGYTRAEIDELIGSPFRYGALVCEEDRNRYTEFLETSARAGGTQTCEYRMRCKDGTLLEVADTMDAKMSSSGVMYGYSVVMDLSGYREDKKLLEQELEKTREQLAQSRVKNASSQMQPHFLYNALSSIREIVLEDPQYASDLIYDFTTHLRACIRSMSSDRFIPFTQELENIRAYVNIEKMRFGDRLNVEYDCPETDFDIIPLSIQPLVENAVRHGVFNQSAGDGKVRVTTSRGDGYVSICVEDNGVGFDFETTMKEVKDGTRDSSGLANLIFRFATLMKAEVSVDSRIGYGTRVEVTIPVEAMVRLNPEENI